MRDDTFNIDVAAVMRTPELDQNEASGSVVVS